jgi:hypothetical protein
MCWSIFLQGLMSELAGAASRRNRDFGVAQRNSRKSSLLLE